MRKKISVLFSLLILLSSMPGCAPSYLPIQKTEFELARNRYELNSGWVCTNIENVRYYRRRAIYPRLPVIRLDARDCARYCADHDAERRLNSRPILRNERSKDPGHL